MKDYRLSELKEICKSMTGNGGCLKCPLYPNVCLTTLRDVVPNKWDIEPRDMIELPYKDKYIDSNGNTVLGVYYKDNIGRLGYWGENEE